MISRETSVNLQWSRKMIPMRAGMVGIMVGRPRKQGKRERNGRPQRTYENPKAQVVAQPHRRLVMAEYRELPEAESEFGRVMLRGIITPAQHRAGELYAQLVVRYRAVWDIPSPSPRGLSLLGSYGPGAAIPDNIAAGIKRDYDRAFEKLGEAGNKAHRAVNAHAVFDHRISDFETIDHLRAGLDKLVDNFKINPQMAITRKKVD